MKRFIPAVAAAALLAAGAAPAQPPPPYGPPPRPPPPACFWTSNITNFAASDEQNLYLRVGAREVWQLKLFSNCFNLDWVHHIAIRSRVGGFGSANVCEGRNPPVEVWVRDPGFGRQSCQVTFVRKLSPAEAAALPKLARP